MVYTSVKTEKFNWEIKQGINGSGQPVYSIYIHDSLRYPGSVTICEFFGSEAEAVCNANHMTACGERVW